jgi:hypothetical protein
LLGRILEGKEGEILYPESKLFYMVLKGSAIVKAVDIEYVREEGETFG